MTAAKKPLVLDVDGTFLKTDLLFEAFWAGLGQQPFRTLAALRHFSRPAALKAELADIVTLRADLLPVSAPVAEMAEAARAEGRRVILASASDARQVRAVAEAHDLDSEVFATEAGRNLKGSAKAAALTEAFGEGGFDYAGNEMVDVAIWEKADKAILVGAPDAARVALEPGKEVEEIAGGWTWSDLLKALRPHQWVKNVLLLLPMLAAHEFGLATLGLVILGMIAFSAAASCIYIVNDLLDLEADRLHAKKHKRPFASGAVPIRVGMAACVGLGLVALGLGALLGTYFFGVVAIYMVLSLAYSLQLKRMRWIDIAVLASLYTLRVVAGAAASRVDASVFMLVFIFPVFLSLGCVKRLTELTLATNDERLPGRGYGKPDRSDLLNVASLGTVAALVIFFLYTFSEQAMTLYPTQWILWVALVPIAVWLIRMVALGYTGKQDYDPIVFAMRDKIGIGILLMTLSLMFYAAGLWAKWFGG